MRYMLMIFNNPAALEQLPEEERNAIGAEVEAIMNELTESGELVDWAALADPAQTKTVRLREGVRTVTDGPFIEAKEHFAGYITIDCDNPQRAVDLAARWPDAKYFWMEVRPIMHHAGMEM